MQTDIIFKKQVKKLLRFIFLRADLILTIPQADNKMITT